MATPPDLVRGGDWVMSLLAQFSCESHALSSGWKSVAASVTFDTALVFEEIFQLFSPT